MKISILALGALSIALVACDKSDHTIVQQDPADQGPAVPKLDPSQLPPSIQASKTYRCKDNSLLYIDWMSDQTARVKSKQADVAMAPAEGELSGTAADSAVTYKGQSCKA